MCIQFEFKKDYFLPNSPQESEDELERALDNEVKSISKHLRDAINHEEIKLDLEEDDKSEENHIFSGDKKSSWAKRLLSTCLETIKITGFNMTKIPAITNLSHLLNTAFYLRKNKVHYEDALEVDFLLGTLLISSKRNTQAIELLRNKV